MEYVEVIKTITLVISSFSILLAFCSFFILTANLKKEPFFLFYIVLCGIAEIVNLYGAYAGIQTLLLIPIFSFIEFILFWKYFRKFIYKRILNNLFYFSLLFSIIDFLIIVYYPTESMFIFSRVFNSLLFTGLSIYLLNKVELDLKIITINLCILSYFAITFIYFLTINFLINVRENTIFLIWILYSVVCVLFHIFLFVSSWKFGKIQKY